MNPHPIQYKYGRETDGVQPLRRVMVDGFFGVEVWRERRNNLLREAEQARLERTAREGRRHSFAGNFLRRVVGIFEGWIGVEYGVVSKLETGGKVRRIRGRDRRCQNRAA